MVRQKHLLTSTDTRLVSLNFIEFVHACIMVL